MHNDQGLKRFLRVTAVVMLAAAFAVVLPHRWMNAVHAWAGLGELPDLPMVGYLARSLSLVYAMVGAYCWVISGDVQRYLPLLRCSVPIALVFSVALIAIDVAAGMPLWWTAVEGTAVLGWTLVAWWLVKRVAR